MIHTLEPEKAPRFVFNIPADCRDITSLFLEAYRWIHVRAGFTAHYDLEGLIEECLTGQNLRDNIVANQT